MSGAINERIGVRGIARCGCGTGRAIDFQLIVDLEIAGVVGPLGGIDRRIGGAIEFISPRPPNPRFGLALVW